jgi:HD superfamily phosphohydrolase
MVEVIRLSSSVVPSTQESAGGELGFFTQFNGQVRDPIYGYIDYTKELEGVVMDSWVLQRLRYIYQLQAAHFVYPGATHSRFSHSIGVMYSSFKYSSFILRSIQYSNLPSDVLSSVRSRQREIITAARLLGLLHDIGHGPFSHAFDKYVYKTRRFLGFRVGNHEVVGYLIYRDYLRDLIERALLENKATLSLDPEYLLSLLDSGLKPPRGMYAYTDLVSKGLLSSSDFYSGGVGFDNVVRMIVRDYIYTSDIMDYLKRDSYFTGVPVGQINDDWIVRNSFIIYRGSEPTIAISMKALDEVSRLFDARRIMYKYVYLHPVNVAFVETIGSLLDCVKSTIVNHLDKMLMDKGGLSEYIALTDHSIYAKLQELLLKNPSEYECEDKAFARKALESLFYHRKPVWKLITRFTYDLEEAKVLFGEIGTDVYSAIKKRIGEELASRYSAKGISEVDIEIMVDKIDVFPTAGGELFNRIEIVDVKDGKIIPHASKTFEEFARDYGLKSEALISLYISRDKYKALEGGDIENIIAIAKSIIDNSIRGRRREAPETS